MLLFFAKTIIKDSRNFELAHLQKKKKEKPFRPSGDFLVRNLAMLFHTAGLIVVYENARR